MNIENIQIDLEKGSIFYHYKNLNPYEYIGPVGFKRMVNGLKL